MKIGQKITEKDLVKNCYWFAYYWLRLEVWENDTEYVFFDKQWSIINTIIKKKGVKNDTEEASEEV